MVKEAIAVHYKKHQVGAVSFDSSTGVGAFEYAPESTAFLCIGWL